MEKKKVMIKAEEAKRMLDAGVLPQRAALIFVRELPDEFSYKCPRHLHHCTGCGCAMICFLKECRIHEMFCPECHGKNPVSQGGK